MNPRHLRWTLWLCSVAAFGSRALLSAQPAKLKVYISVDMEGVVGTVTGDQLIPGSFEYERYRQFMTLNGFEALSDQLSAKGSRLSSC